MAPHSAKGSAKIECSHLIISSVTRRLCKTGTNSIVMQRRNGNAQQLSRKSGLKKLSYRPKP